MKASHFPNTITISFKRIAHSGLCFMMMQAMKAVELIDGQIASRVRLLEVVDEMIQSQDTMVSLTFLQNKRETLSTYIKILEFKKVCASYFLVNKVREMAS